MKLSIIVAVAENNVIGKDNQLIWRLPADLKHLKALTMGHPMVMGRKTFDSIGKPLPGRTSIIITRQPNYTVEGCLVVHSLEQAIIEAGNLRTEEAFIVGGAEVYRQSMSITDKIYLTEVHHSFDGDTFFPKIDPTIWKEVKRESFPADEKNAYDFDFVELENTLARHTKM
nr:Dihydrofolate reductase [uncultured bacterium]